MQRGLCCNYKFEKTLAEAAEIQLDTDHSTAYSLLSEMLVQGEFRQNNVDLRAARASFFSLGSLLVQLSTLRETSISKPQRPVRNCVVMCKVSAHSISR